MSITLVATRLAPTIIQFAEKNLREYIKGQVDQKVVNIVIERTQDKINELVKRVERRTQIYVLLTLVGVIPSTISLFFVPPVYLRWIVLAFILSFMTYMMVSFILAFNTMVNFVIEFDQKLLAALEEEFQKVKEENWKNKVALLYSGRDGKDYFHHVLSHIVIAVCAWLKENKYHLYVRLVSYALAAFCLSTVVSTLLHN